jgi:hypothetical protein
MNFPMLGNGGRVFDQAKWNKYDKIFVGVGLVGRCKAIHAA